MKTQKIQNPYNEKRKNKPSKDGLEVSVIVAVVGGGGGNDAGGTHILVLSCGCTYALVPLCTYVPGMYDRAPTILIQYSYVGFRPIL